MIPIDQDFIVCYYCNQHIKIKDPFEIAKHFLYSRFQYLDHVVCHNCKYISYDVIYCYNPHFDDSSHEIDPTDIVVSAIKILVKNDVFLYLNIDSDDWDPGLYSLNSFIHKFNKLDKLKFLQYPAPILINKMNKLLAFI